MFFCQAVDGMTDVPSCSSYSVLSFPLTDQMPDRDTLGPPPEPVAVSSNVSRQVTGLTNESTTLDGDAKRGEQSLSTDSFITVGMT